MDEEDGVTLQPDRVLIGTSTSGKTKRYIPIIPALPNGLKDVLSSTSTESTSTPEPRHTVDALLNPCNCKDVWKCQCRNNTPLSTAALDALASAAASLTDVPPDNLISKHKSSRPPSPHQHKRVRHNHRELAPILAPVLASAGPSSVPEFPVIPPLSSISSLVGSACCCGLECACPGCIEHRGQAHASKDHADCPGCGTCVDRQLDIALPGHEASQSSVDAFLSSSSSVLDTFLARAAALPAPPTPWDWMNPYESLRTPVALPKLECCGGECKCPPKACGCNKSCDGCCLADSGEDYLGHPCPREHEEPCQGCASSDPVSPESSRESSSLEHVTSVTFVIESVPTSGAKDGDASVMGARGTKKGCCH
ncbi:hypothetical protein FISHEDRAFT_76771 [Fistulina hepatica ATCC 64428]|uniref:Uncharacterized protein n=1 Tax=Fistulina hepatica ATCC 64428 TaxID=1128425 RepID=A0A0D7A376_9AGAR|nr:hypothetical protein FISHEDRAFT_76771 [Fistulina hepatica ATCC 64428]